MKKFFVLFLMAVGFFAASQNANAAGDTKFGLNAGVSYGLMMPTGVSAALGFPVAGLHMHTSMGTIGLHAYVDYVTQAISVLGSPAVNTKFTDITALLTVGKNVYLGVGGQYAIAMDAGNTSGANFAFAVGAYMSPKLFLDLRGVMSFSGTTTMNNTLQLGYNF